MKSYESKAKTREEAIALGLQALGVSIADVEIETIDEGKKGVLGILGSKPAIVRLTVKEDDGTSVMSEVFSSKAAPIQKPKVEKKAETKPEKVQTPKAEIKPEKKLEKKVEKKAEAKPENKTVNTVKASIPSPAAKEDLEKKAHEFLSTITHLMGVDVAINMARDEEQNIRVNMSGDTLGILIGRRGETLDALQYLTSLYINRGQEEYTRITLDNENYRAKREEALVRLANRMANRAVKTGRKVVLEPMNPYERRILHSALSNHEFVTTHSEGEEPNRHVVITLK